MEKSVIDWIAMILVIIGAVNIGLAELGFDVLDIILGSVAWLDIIVAYLIGLAGLWAIYLLVKK